MFAALSNAASSVGNAVSGAADSVSNAVTGAAREAMLLVAESEIKKQTGMEIDVDCENVPGDWNGWMMKTGVNSLCNEDTWSFLDNSTHNKKKIELWKQRGIKKIIMKVDETPDPDLKDWCTCMPSWEAGSTTLVLTWLPRAKHHASDNFWNEPGYKRWWVLSDEIVFGLQLYQLPGKCFYKSDWLEGFEDVDPDGLLPTSTKKFRRWFQFRHWVIMWYANDMWGWNYQWTENRLRTRMARTSA